MVDKIIEQSELISHLVYGDIDEVPLSILGDDSPGFEEYNKMDVEQRTRLAAASTVSAFFDDRLLQGGSLAVDSGDIDVKVTGKPGHQLPLSSLRDYTFEHRMVTSLNKALFAVVAGSRVRYEVRRHKEVVCSTAWLKRAVEKYNELP